jgi:hypothetical protein
MSLRDAMIAARRQAELRLLAEYGDSLNEPIVRMTIRQLGFSLASADDVRADLDHLVRHGCLTERWEGAIRIVRLTERGEDAAHGRIEVAGVERAPWRRE